MQGTEAWLWAKAASFSSSKFNKLIVDHTKKTIDKRLSYIREKVYNNFLVILPENPTSAGMRRGTNYEPEARFQFVRQYKIVPEDWTIAHIDEYLNVGKCYFDDNFPLHIISPDGYCDIEEFGTEFKTAETNIKFSECCETVRQETSNEDLKAFDPVYYWQVMDNLYASGAKYWWFVYFMPEMQHGHDLHAVKIYPDEAAFETIKTALSDGITIYKDILGRKMQIAL